MTQKISVIIPLHNKGPHIVRALKSVASQDLKPHEVIVIDDASTDNGAQLARDFSGIDINLLQREAPGPGGYAARNFGIKQASGDWIAFLDADDEWLPDHLSNAAAAFAPEIGCVFTARTIRPGDVHWPNSQQSTFLDTTKLDADAILRAWLAGRHCPLWTGAVLVRRSLFETIGYFREGGITRGGDKDMWLRIVTATQSAYCGKPTAIFYQDTVNRVSNRAQHTMVPAIVETIDRLADQSSTTRKLLHRLKNQELALYSRYSVGKGARLPIRFLKELEIGAKGSGKVIALFLLSQLVALRR